MVPWRTPERRSICRPDAFLRWVRPPRPSHRALNLRWRHCRPVRGCIPQLRTVGALFEVSRRHDGDIGVEDILRLGGDATTVVQSQRVRPEFTAFGQTVWSLDDQTRFAAHLPCLGMAEADAVITQMSNSAQRWGIADDGAPAKGGWGPDEQGNYLVRQFGVMQTPAGQTAVSLAAYPADGSFDSGVAAVNRLADWLDAHRADLPSGTCAAG